MARAVDGLERGHQGDWGGPLKSRHRRLVSGSAGNTVGASRE
jgi:hypothetical protein